MGDMVNHPAHYTQHVSGIECIQITENMESPNLANAFKYLFRAGLKGGDIDTHRQDLCKARFYVLREISRLRDEPKNVKLDFLAHEPNEAFHALLEADDGGGIQSLSKVIDCVDAMMVGLVDEVAR